MKRKLEDSSHGAEALEASKKHSLISDLQVDPRDFIRMQFPLKFVTRIVAQKYCTDTVKGLQREPSNSNDPFAIRALDGYLSGGLARHLSPLWDSNAIQIELQTPLQQLSPSVVSISVTLTNVELSTATFDQRQCLYGLLRCVDKAPRPEFDASQFYVRQFQVVADAVLARTRKFGLFEEQHLANHWYFFSDSLSMDAKRLYCRLLQRRKPFRWFHVLSLSYTEITDINDAIDGLLQTHTAEALSDGSFELCAGFSSSSSSSSSFSSSSHGSKWQVGGFVQRSTDIKNPSFDFYVEIFPSVSLKLLRAFGDKVKFKFNNGRDYKTGLLKFLRTQRTFGFVSTQQVRLCESQQVLRHFHALCGQYVCFTFPFFYVVKLLYQLFNRSRTPLFAPRDAVAIAVKDIEFEGHRALPRLGFGMNDEPISSPGFILEEIGRVSYHQFKTAPVVLTPLFESRDSMLAHDHAMQIRQEFEKCAELINASSLFNHPHNQQPQLIQELKPLDAHQWNPPTRVRASTFICATCTFINPIKSRHCTMCQTPAPLRVSTVSSENLEPMKVVVEAFQWVGEAIRRLELERAQPLVTATMPCPGSTLHAGLFSQQDVADSKTVICVESDDHQQNELHGSWICPSCTVRNTVKNPFGLLLLHVPCHVCAVARGMEEEMYTPKFVPDDVKEESFSGQLGPQSTYVSICHQGVSLLEKARRYHEACLLLVYLLNQSQCLYRRGAWWDRLTLNLDKHLQQPKTAFMLAKFAISRDPFLRTGSLVNVHARLQALTKGRRIDVTPEEKHNAEACVRQFSMSLAKETSLTIPRTTLHGRPLSKVRGKKSIFFGYDNEQVSVEELCLQYYAMPLEPKPGELQEVGGGEWAGRHCEGSFLRTLFGICLWDILFDGSIPNVFQNPFQDAPLDLFTDTFFSARRDSIEILLARVAIMTPLQLEKFVENQYRLHCYTACRGTHWEEWSLHDLVLIACAIGGPALSTVFTAMCKDYRHWSGGLPDLLLWRRRPTASSIDARDDRKEGLSTHEVKLVEVKGPRDRLSAQQIAWLHLLSGHINVELCLVVERELPSDTDSA